MEKTRTTIVVRVFLEAHWGTYGYIFLWSPGIEAAAEAITFRVPEGNAVVGASIARPFAAVSSEVSSRADATTVLAIIRY